jgi:hypothetical protein
MYVDLISNEFGFNKDRFGQKFDWYGRTKELDQQVKVRYGKPVFDLHSHCVG